MLTGMSLAQAETVLLARGNRPFRSLEDFAQRTRLGRAAAMRLAKADAFASLMLDRRAALWDALEQDLQQTDRPLLADIAEDRADLPPLTPAEEVLADYRAVGLSLRAHPLSFLRADLAAMGVAPARSLAEGPDDRNVCVAGIVLVRQRPSTAKGITFVTLEDETGTANLIVRPAVWKRFRTAALGATLLLVAGRLQRQGEVIHVLVTRLDDLSARLAGLGAQSRYFC
jgi:error-prone DNA polymerase